MTSLPKHRATLSKILYKKMQVFAFEEGRVSLLGSLITCVITYNGKLTTYSITCLEAFVFTRPLSGSKRLIRKVHIMIIWSKQSHLTVVFCKCNSWVIIGNRGEVASFGYTLIDDTVVKNTFGNKLGFMCYFNMNSFLQWQDKY